jgi:hypothetical protein
VDSPQLYQKGPVLTFSQVAKAWNRTTQDTTGSLDFPSVVTAREHGKFKYLNTSANINETYTIRNGIIGGIF